MNKITIKLPDPIKLKFGNPLNLEFSEERIIDMDKRVLDLLRNGAIVPVVEKVVTKVCEPIKTVKKQPKEPSVEKKKVKTTKTSIKLKIRGVGVETLADINKQFKNEKDLIEGLKNDKVSLRNDVVKKLKKYFKIR